jgi:hypothetical protein
MIYLDVTKVFRIHFKDVFKYIFNIIFNFDEIIHIKKYSFVFKCSKKIQSGTFLCINANILELCIDRKYLKPPMSHSSPIEPLTMTILPKLVI